MPAMLESLGFDRRPMRVAGGSAADPWFRQQLADATGRGVIAPIDGDSDYSALGAAAVPPRADRRCRLAGRHHDPVPAPERGVLVGGAGRALDRARGGWARSEAAEAWPGLG